jgi:tripartite-type tricarboxylate transporter receptor subunit TctC
MSRESAFRIRSTMTTRFRIAVAIALVAAAGGLAGPAFAQAYPDRPVRFVLSFGAPGGTPDITARLIAPRLTELWGGRQLVVDPRSGAGGVVGTDIVAKAAPDGYTLLMVSPAHTINPSLRKLPYDSVKDFVPVTKLMQVPNILSVYPPLGPKTVQDLVALARAKPGQLSYGSAGIGSSQHLAGALFAKMANVQMVHVPYKGGAAVVLDLIAGRVQLTFGSSTSMPHIRAGRLTALAVSTEKRLPQMPDTPTIAESGFPGYEASAWYGLLVPAGTPRPIVMKLHKDFTAVLTHPAVREVLSAEVIETVPSASPEDFGRYMVAEAKKWGALVRESGAKAD